MLERYDPRNWPISYDGVIHTLIVLGSAVALALQADGYAVVLAGRGSSGHLFANQRPQPARPGIQDVEQHAVETAGAVPP